MQTCFQFSWFLNLEKTLDFSISLLSKMLPVFSADTIETDGSRRGITGSKSCLAEIRDLVALFPVGVEGGGLSAPRESLGCLYVQVRSSDSL